MTVERIIADCDEHDIHITIGRIPGLTTQKRWACRIGDDLRKMRLADTYQEAVYSAWLAYTGAEVA